MFVAKEGGGLEALVRAAVPLCREAERLPPRRGPGRKPEVPDWVVAVLILAATAKKRKSKSAQYRFIVAYHERSCAWMNVERLPGRTQYFDRFRRAHRLLDAVVELTGRWAVERGRNSNGSSAAPPNARSPASGIAADLLHHFQEHERRNYFRHCGYRYN